MKTKSLLMGIVAGSAIIGGLTLLTTPKAGKEMRVTCRENIQKVRNGLDQLTYDSKKASLQLKQTIQVGKETFSTVGEEIKGSIDDWKTDVEPSLVQLKEDIEALQQSVNQTKKIT
ncbi:YtxH domain-containing protein [Halalkalibacter alkalisediminis]|uniref:YtxH domain-containing protein n=1 Tax=Halalkalibacter alkalisediminis TaxID=935616 RepID=A0ABV6NNV3_9BACI|nr:hypothetical protein [Halalkalibacter alkalisediminis]